MGRALAWHGTGRWVAIPMPSSRVRIDIGAVGPGEETTDFSALAARRPRATGPGSRGWAGRTWTPPATTTWPGFRVHGEPTPGRRRSTRPAPLAEVPAYPGGILTDGYGLGGYGQGGFGRAASLYRVDEPVARRRALAVRGRLRSTPRATRASRS